MIAAVPEEMGHFKHGPPIVSLARGTNIFLGRDRKKTSMWVGVAKIPFQKEVAEHALVTSLHYMQP